MVKLIFPCKTALKKWLPDSSAIAFMSVTHISNTSKLEYRVANSAELSVALEIAPEYFPDGMYEIEYMSSTGHIYNLSYTQLAMALSFELSLSKVNATLGGLSALLEALVEFEYFYVEDKTSPAYSTAVVWARVPDEQRQAEKLKCILQEYSVMYAFGDVRGRLSLDDARMGNGIGKLAAY